MKAVQTEKQIDYSLTQKGQLAVPGSSMKQPAHLFRAQPQTLAFFLAERYLLFANTKQGLAAGRVYHTPYPLQSGMVTQYDDRLITMAGFDAPARPPDSVLLSTGVDVHVYPLQPTANPR